MQVIRRQKWRGGRISGSSTATRSSTISKTASATCSNWNGWAVPTCTRPSRARPPTLNYPCLWPKPSPLKLIVSRYQPLFLISSRSLSILLSIIYTYICMYKYNWYLMTILIDKTCNGLLEHGYSCMYLYHIYIYINYLLLQSIVI